MLASRLVLSGLSYTGSTTLAEALAAELGWPVVLAGERFRAYCKKHGLNASDITAIPEVIHLDFDKELCREMEVRERVVFEGRIAIWLSRNIANCARVWCQADEVTRVSRCASRENIGGGKAEEIVKFRDEREAAFFDSMYGLSLNSLQGMADVVVANEGEATRNELALKVVERLSMAH